VLQVTDPEAVSYLIRRDKRGDKSWRRLNTSTNSSNSFVVIVAKDLSSSYQFLTMPSKCKVAAIQAEPCWNDLKGSIAKTIGLIQEAAGKGANVIGFPEIFIPGYPW